MVHSLQLFTCASTPHESHHSYHWLLEAMSPSCCQGWAETTALCRCCLMSAKAIRGDASIPSDSDGSCTSGGMSLKGDTAPQKHGSLPFRFLLSAGELVLDTHAKILWKTTLKSSEKRSAQQIAVTLQSCFRLYARVNCNQVKLPIRLQAGCCVSVIALRTTNCSYKPRCFYLERF